MYVAMKTVVTRAKGRRLPTNLVPRLRSLRTRLRYRTAYCIIRESVDSLCRDGADAQYMQYLSKSRITSPQTRKKLI